MRPAYQLPQGAMHAMPAMPVAGAHGHVSSPHVVMRAPLPGYGSPTAQMHQVSFQMPQQMPAPRVVLPGQMPMMQAVRSLPAQSGAGVPQPQARNAGGPMVRMKSEDQSPMVQKAKTEVPLRGIISKFQMAMSRESEMTRATTLEELDEVAANALQDIADKERKRGSPTSGNMAKNSSRSILKRSSTTNSIGLVRPSVKSPRSVQQVERQSSQPSLKAAVLVAGVAGGQTPRSPGWKSPRSPRFKEEPDAFVTPLVTRSMSAKIGLLEGRLSSEDSLEVSIQSMKSIDVSDSYEEYKHAAERVRALQQQLGRAASPEVVPTKRTASLRSPIEEDDMDDEPEVVVVKARSLRESTRLQSKRILPLGDSDDEDGVTGHPTLKVVETGVVTNEGIDTSPAAKHRGKPRNRQDA